MDLSRATDKAPEKVTEADRMKHPEPFSPYHLQCDSSTINYSQRTAHAQLP